MVRVILTLGTAQTIAWASSYYLPAILANQMAADLGLSTPWVFIAFSIGLLVSGFGGPLSGRLIDSHGGRRVLPSSNLVFAIALTMLGCATGPLSLMAAWIVMGVAMSCGLYEAAFSSLARIYGEHARKAITGITLIAGFASTIGWPITAGLEAAYGWRAACFAWAIAHVAICLPFNLWLPPATSVHEATAVRAAAPADRRTRWLMAGLSFVFAATWFGSTAMAAHLPRVLQAAGATLPVAIAVGALIGPAQVAARILEFSLMRHAKPITSAQVASLAHPSGVGILCLAGAAGAPVFALLHGAGNGVMTIANGTLPLHLFGAKGYGLRQGLLMMPARFLQAASPFLFDLLLTRFGTGALMVTAGFGVASFATLTMIRRNS